MAYDQSADAAVPRSVFWLLALWVLVALGALVYGVDNAEMTLRDAARRSLAAGGHTSIAVDFSGRDARLIGTAESEAVAHEIADEIDAIPGVRMVNNEITVAEPPAAASVGPEIAVRLAESIVSLSGLVPTKEVESELFEAAELEFGVGHVVNALVVSDDVASEPWLGRIRDVFSHLGALRTGGFTASESGLTIEGEVISESAREQTLEEIRLIVGDLLPVTSKMTVVVLPAPTFDAMGRDDTITLQGVLPDQETIDFVVAAAERLHANTVVVDLLEVGPVSGPPWLDSIGGVLDVVTRLDPWTIAIADGELTITGLALDEEVVAAVDVLADEVVGDQLTISTDVQVDPAAVATQLTQLLEGTATFEIDSAELSSEGMALLDSAIAILVANPSTQLIVEGYTDNQGDPDANKALSQLRADAVVAYLVAGGIDPQRLTAVGYGEERPIADNSTEEGRALNRRIEFVIQQGDG